MSDQLKIPAYILDKITNSNEQYEDGFIDGWKHCSSDIEATLEAFLKREGDLRKEIAELKEDIKEFQHDLINNEAIIKQLEAQLEIAKEALKIIATQDDKKEITGKL
jgi:chromosome segregation ATPase